MLRNYDAHVGSNHSFINNHMILKTFMSKISIYSDYAICGYIQSTQ